MSSLNPLKKILPLGLAFLSLALCDPARAVEISFEEDHALPVVYINVAIKAGSVTDPAGQSGLTNFMGEMLLRGTKTRNKEQIDLALDQMGASIGVETRAEAMIVRGAVLRAQLDPFLALLSEIVTQPSFPEGEIRKLKSEITSGILEELGRDASLANRRFTRFLFQGHPYGKPVLGTVKDIGKLSRPQMVAHYERIVRDANLLVVGTGDADLAQLSKWARNIGQLRSKGKAEKPIASVAAPVDATKPRYLLIDKPDRTQSQIYGGQIGLRMTDPSFFPLFLGNYAFGGGSFSARMMVEIRVKRGWSYGAYSNFRHGLKPRSWSFYLFPASKDTPAALAYSIQMVRELKERGITQAEFDFNKASLINSAGFMYNTPKKRVENKLLERTLDLPDGFMKTYAAELSKVTLEQVNQSLRDYLRPDRMTVAVLGTAQELREPIAKALGVSPDQIEVVPYTQEQE